jgi:Tetracyclin repressor-like, C-terminal domain
MAPAGRPRATEHNTDDHASTVPDYAIPVEAGIHPAIRAQLLSTGARLNTWFMTWLRVAGSTDPERDAPVIMNHYTGVVLHDLAIPDPAFDPTDQITVRAAAGTAGHVPVGYSLRCSAVTATAVPGGTSMEPSSTSTCTSPSAIRNVKISCSCTSTVPRSNGPSRRVA